MTTKEQVESDLVEMTRILGLRFASLKNTHIAFMWWFVAFIGSLLGTITGIKSLQLGGSVLGYIAIGFQWFYLFRSWRLSREYRKVSERYDLNIMLLESEANLIESQK